VEQWVRGVRRRERGGAKRCFSVGRACRARLVLVQLIASTAVVRMLLMGIEDAMM